jgi:hypothetical protein
MTIFARHQHVVTVSAQWSRQFGVQHLVEIKPHADSMPTVSE